MRSFSLLRLCLLVLVAVAIGGGLASAGDFQGNFTLPFEARWGMATLPPGDYTFRRDSHFQIPLLIVRGENTAALVAPSAGYSKGKVTGTSSLIAVRTGGQYRIRALRLAEVGLVIEYAIPKGEQNLVAQGPVLIRRVPITMTGK